MRKRKRGRNLSKKKGLSTIIVTVLLIGLTIVAVGIVWAVISNILRKGAEDISSSASMLDLQLKLQSAKIENSNLIVSVSRGGGQGTLEGVAIFISDGTNTQIIEKQEIINSLDTKVYTITPAELTSVGFAKEVSIAPLIRKGNGFIRGSIVDNQKLSTKQIFAGLGAVSWWKLEGNANDEFGNNNGVIQGSLIFINGKFGNAGNFTGKGEKVDCGNNANLNGATGFSYSVWARREGNSNNQWPMIVYHGDSHKYYGLRTNNYGGNVYFEYGKSPYDGTVFAGTASGLLPVNEWHYFTSTYDGSTLKMYKDSVLLGTQTSITLYPNFDRFRINDGTFNGTIDEPIFFNKALTAQQVQALYKLDLSSA